MTLRAAPPFRPHPLLAGFHRQTLAAAFWPAPPPPATRSERRVFDVGEGNAVVALVDRPQRAGAPALLLLHGLTGSADSTYMRRAAGKAVAAGFLAVRLNQRNCGGTETLCRTLYHGGLFEDVLAVARALVAAEGLRRLHVAGFSLGGNLALRLAASFGDAPPSWLAGVTTVSAALELGTCADAIDTSPELFAYRRLFVSGLKATLRRRARLDGAARRDLSGLGHLDTVRALDDRFTAPEFGFAGADDYYARASAGPRLGAIAVSTRLVAARDDAFVPIATHERALAGASERVEALIVARGGHCAFVGRGTVRAPDTDRFWAENRIIEHARATCATPEEDLP